MRQLPTGVDRLPGVACPTQITANNKDHSGHSRIYHVTVRRSENIQRANPGPEVLASFIGNSRNCCCGGRGFAVPVFRRQYCGGVEAAYAATEVLQSYRISGSNIVSMNDQSSEVGFSWAFTDKNRYHGMIFENGQTEEFIIVGEDQYRRVTVDNRSSSTFIDEFGEGGVNIFSPFPGKRDTLGLLNSLVDIRDLPDLVVGGVQTTHHRGRVDIDKLRSHAIALDPLAGDFRDNLEALGIPAIDYQEALEFLGAPRKIIVNVDLWISKDEFHIRQMKLSGASAVTSSGGVEQIGGITWDTTVKFSDFNETINIERPLIASGNAQSYWRLSERRPFYSNIETEKR